MSFGRAFEEALDWIHNRYKASGRAIIFRTKVAGRWIGKDKFVAVKSLPDFMGILPPGGRFFAFDAKSTGNLNKWKLRSRAVHQYRDLCDFDRFGAIAFFLIEAREKEALFVLPVRSEPIVRDHRPFLIFDLYEEFQAVRIPIEPGRVPDYLSSILPLLD